jgi:RHS repeat-associated protein
VKESNQKGVGRYYPFGLTMAGISDKALKTNYTENKYRFQKQELQNREFSDGSGLEMYEFKNRFDDCQIGRFWSVDPLANKYEYNSPYAFSENKVTSHIELEGLEATPLGPAINQLKEEFNQFGRSIDHMFDFTTSHDHMTSKSNPAKNIEVKKSVETDHTHGLNFGLGDFMEHLTRTNSSAGGPSLKMEIVNTSDVKDNTTTTTKVGGLTIVGVVSTSRTTGNTETQVTVAGGGNLGMIPNPQIGIGITTNTDGTNGFNFNLSGNQQVGKTNYSAGVQASESGKSAQKSSASGTASFYWRSSSDSDTYKSSFNIHF